MPLVLAIVEEAAQVLEPHVVASLTASCQHLIMIGNIYQGGIFIGLIKTKIRYWTGDHLQLRPQCNVQKLATQFHMEVSLFERLIKLGVPSVMLSEQHRMRPEVSRLIVPSIYRNLVNHESVYKYPTVPSVNRSVFFLTHNNPEEQEKGAHS